MISLVGVLARQGLIKLTKKPWRSFKSSVYTCNSCRSNLMQFLSQSSCRWKITWAHCTSYSFAQKLLQLQVRDENCTELLWQKSHKHLHCSEHPPQMLLVAWILSFEVVQPSGVYLLQKIRQPGRGLQICASHSADSSPPITLKQGGCLSLRLFLLWLSCPLWISAVFKQSIE